MSLINQMLRDLDKRHGLSQAATALPESVRPAQSARTDRKAFPILLSVVVLATLGVASMVYWLTGGEAPSPPPQVVATAPIMPAPLVADTTGVPIEALNPPPLGTPAPPVDAGATSRMDAPATSPNARPDAPRLRTSMALSQPGRPAPRVEKLPATDDPAAQIERRYRDALNMMNKGKVREAMEALYAITRERPEHVAAWQVLVRLLLEQGRPDEAIRVLQEITRSRPDSQPATLQLARLQAEYGTDAQALQTLLAAQEAGADNADYHGLLANLLQRQKRSVEAAGAYRRALTLRPTEGRWWIGLGLCLEESGQKEEAKAAWRQGLQSGNLPADLRQFAESKLSGG